MWVLDNDEAGVLVSTTVVQVTENSATTYSVVLSSQPAANVTVTASPPSNATTHFTLAPLSLTFTPQSWNVSQTVTVTGLVDGVVTPTLSFAVTYAAVSNDTFYNVSYGVAPAGSLFRFGEVITVRVVDSPMAQVMLSPVAVSVQETYTNSSYTVLLDSPPLSNVTVTLAPAAASVTRINASPRSLTFTPSNWNVGQNVTVWAIINAVRDGTQLHYLTHNVTSVSDPRYRGNTTAFTPSNNFLVRVFDDNLAPCPSGTEHDPCKCVCMCVCVLCCACACFGCGCVCRATRQPRCNLWRCAS